MIGEQATAALASRLNRPGKDRLAATWELVVLSSFSTLGILHNEAPLPSGRRPDVTFDNGMLAFTADVATVSDEGLDERNPYNELSELLELTKSRLGLKVGGMYLRVESRQEKTSRGSKTVLRLPERKRLRAFVRDEIEPRLREQIAEGKDGVLQIAIEDDTAAIQITIDPNKSPHSYISYASYDVPTIKDRNPLYNALRSKVGQLRSASGIVGVIVGDGDSRTLADRQWSRSAVDASAIADEFLRQNSSIHFVLLLSVREELPAWHHAKPPVRQLHAVLALSKTTAVPRAIEDLFKRMLGEMPKPIAMPVNAALRSREAGYGWGYHGGHQMSPSRIKFSVREIMEMLAGRRTVQEMNSSHGWYSRGEVPQPNMMSNPFERHLQEGRLPSAISIMKTDENESDDWVEIEFANPDPAISPFR